MFCEQWDNVASLYTAITSFQVLIPSAFSIHADQLLRRGLVVSTSALSPQSNPFWNRQPRWLSVVFFIVSDRSFRVKQVRCNMPQPLRCTLPVITILPFDVTWPWWITVPGFRTLSIVLYNIFGPPTFHGRGLVSIPGESTWDLWWTKWHCTGLCPFVFSYHDAASVPSIMY
jgi:hypothetical protein